MAYVISILSENPDVQQAQGEKVLLLSLSSHPQLGYRLKGETAGTGRPVGRWMSDCPLAISETAMLWASRFGWVIQLGPESLDIQQVLDTVPQISPMHTPGVHPRDALALLLENLPPKDPSSPETGAVIQLGARVPQLAGPTQAPLAPAPRRRKRSQPKKRLEGEAKDMAMFLRDSIRALGRGARPDEIRGALVDVLALDESEEPLALQVGPGATPGHYTPLPPMVEPQGGALQIPPVPPHYSQPEVPRQPVQKSAQHFLPELPPGLRPLMPGESLVGGPPDQQAALASLGQSSGADRAKLMNGWEHDQQKYGSRPALSSGQAAEVEAWHQERRMREQVAPPQVAPPQMAPPQMARPQMAPPQVASPVLVQVPSVGAATPSNGHSAVYDPMSELSPWAQRALGAAGLASPEAVSGYSAGDISKINGVGPKVLSEIQAWLAARQMTLAPSPTI